MKMNSTLRQLSAQKPLWIRTFILRNIIALSFVNASLKNIILLFIIISTDLIYFTS